MQRPPWMLPIACTDSPSSTHALGSRTAQLPAHALLQGARLEDKRAGGGAGGAVHLPDMGGGPSGWVAPHRPAHGAGCLGAFILTPRGGCCPLLRMPCACLPPSSPKPHAAPCRPPSLSVGFPGTPAGLQPSGGCHCRARGLGARLRRQSVHARGAALPHLPVRASGEPGARGWDPAGGGSSALGR